VKKNNDSIQLYFVETDHLGSILSLYNENGQQSFSAWGRDRNPQTWKYSTNNNTKPEWLIRGYTGHEHCDEFGLINMNGRMYDPVLGRMLSPDNFVQDPSSSQSYNRYSYCWNNPLKYTDPSGEFVWTINFMIGFINGFTSTSSGRWDAGFTKATERSANGIKIAGGLLASDPNKTFGGRVLETLSRFTWQLPQTVGGLLTAQAYNTFGFKGGVESVNYKYGSTVVKTKGSWGAVAQGSYIVGDNTIEADANNPLFQHEYGHYIQSQGIGLAYYVRVGIPSILSNGDHNFHPVEQDANRRAFLYFNEKVDGFKNDDNHFDNLGWHFGENPFDVNKTGQGQYINYQNATDLESLNNIRVRPSFTDYYLLFLSGFLNAYEYNH